MHEQIKHTEVEDKIAIEILTNRFTHDLVHDLKNLYPYNLLFKYNFVEFNLRKVKMIDSSSIGYLFEVHNKLKANNNKSEVLIAVGDNNDLRDLLHKFQVDLLLKIN